MDLWNSSLFLSLFILHCLLESQYEPPSFLDIFWPLQDICNLPMDWITVIKFYEVRDGKKAWTILDPQSWELDAQYTCGSDLLAFVMEDKIWICICFNNPSLALLEALDWSIHPCRIANILYTQCSFLFLMRYFVMSRTEWLL